METFAHVLYPYLKYVVIALVLCWRSIHRAVINFQLLNLAVWFDIWKDLSVAHAVFGRFLNHISVFHVSLVLDLISTLNWFDSVWVWNSNMVSICLMIRWSDRFWWRWESIKEKFIKDIRKGRLHTIGITK